jgi:hypothetical protein
MHVVRQHDPSIQMKREAPAHLAHAFAQRLDLCDEQIGTAVAQVYREEVRRPGDAVAPVVRHDGIVDGRVANRTGSRTRVEYRAGTAGCASLHPPYNDEGFDD